MRAKLCAVCLLGAAAWLFYSVILDDSRGSGPSMGGPESRSDARTGNGHHGSNSLTAMSSDFEPAAANEVGRSELDSTDELLLHLTRSSGFPVAGCGC